MRFSILTNSLIIGDAVSTHCRLLQRHLQEMGHETRLFAQWHEPGFEAEVRAPAELNKWATPNSILLHQFYNATPLIDQVCEFRGRAVMMYHNITPPEFMHDNPGVRASCLRGLKQAEAFAGLYSYAVGMSEFSRQDLVRLGFLRTGVFPLLMDLEGLRETRFDPFHLAKIRPTGTTLLSVNRLAPNKRQDLLVELLAEYRKVNPDVWLRLVGSNGEHKEYAERVVNRCRELGLEPGRDVVLTGRVSPTALRSEFMRADALVSASEHEGYGAVLIESMAMGVPTFAVPKTAVAETMNGAGQLLEPNDVSAWARQIHECLSDQCRRGNLLDGQRRRVEAESPANQRRRLEELVETLAQLPEEPTFKPRVSVVINTLNRDRWLERCLLSLRQQSYDNFEVVVVNGPSEDDTEAVIRQFEAEISVGRVGRAVLCISRNEGIALANGELIVFIDDDAIAATDWLEKIVRPFRAGKVGAVSGTVLRMNGRDIEFRNGIIDRLGGVKWNEPLPGLHCDWEEGYLNTLSGGTTAVRRTALEQIGGFDERIEYYHDEADIALRVQAAGWRVEHCPSAVIYHEAAPSNVRRQKHLINRYVVVKNTIYVAVRNHVGTGKRGLALASAKHAISSHAGSVRSLRRERHLSMWAYLLGFLQIARGAVAGVWRGLYNQPSLRRFKPAEPGSFVPYRRNRPELAICLLSRELPQSCTGGIPTYSLNLARSLVRIGCQVHIVTGAAGVRPGFRDGIWFHAATAHRLRENILENARTPHLRHLIEYSSGVRLVMQDIQTRWGLDVAESPNWDFEGLLPAAEYRLPIVVRTHSPMFQVSQSQQWKQTKDLMLGIEAEGLLLFHATALVGSTNAILDLVLGYYSLNGKRAERIPLGLEIESAELQREQESLTVLFLGRLERRKGIHVLLEAIGALLEEFPNVRFVIAGRDSDRGDGQTWANGFLKEMQGRAGVDRVEFRGEVPEQELHRTYASCDVFVAPSLFESFGLIYVEAMAQGRPVVACRSGGTPEVVLDGETGVLVTPGDARELASAIGRLLRDGELRNRLGAAGLHRYRNHFTGVAAARNALKFYQSVVQQWQVQGRFVHMEEALDLRRGARTEIVWHKDLARAFVMYNHKEEETVVFGPYVELAAGTYRTEFALWLGDCPRESHVVGRLDVYNGSGPGIVAEKSMWAEDFCVAPGRVFDLIFKVGPDAPAAWEFRVHSSGEAPLHVSWIRASVWPPSEAVEAAQYIAERVAAMGGPQGTTEEVSQ